MLKLDECGLRAFLDLILINICKPIQLGTVVPGILSLLLKQISEILLNKLLITSLKLTFEIGLIFLLILDCQYSIFIEDQLDSKKNQLFTISVKMYVTRMQLVCHINR